MSTIWEMAGTIRAEEERALRACPTKSGNGRGVRVEIGPPEALEFWCRFLGTTPMDLCCAIEEVGDDPTLVRRFLATRRRFALA